MINWPYYCALSFGSASIIVGIYPITGPSFVYVVVGLVLLLAAFDARLSTWEE